MVQVLADLSAYPPTPQPEEGVTYAAKITKEEARLRFEGAAETERAVRAFRPAPGAFFEWQGERIRLLAAEVDTSAEGRSGEVLDERLTIGCGAGGGALRPTLVQRAGRAAMTPAELLRGFPIPPGAMLA
jgi:methionyl-tRNA formyltransferase